MIYTLYVDLAVLKISAIVIAILIALSIAYLKGTGQKLFLPVPLEKVFEGIQKRSELDEAYTSESTNSK